MDIKIDETTLNEAANASFNKLFNEDNYSNPIKKILENEFQWNMDGSGKSELAKQLRIRVDEIVAKLIDSSEFHIMIGQQIANKFAEAAVKDLRRLKDNKLL